MVAPTGIVTFDNAPAGSSARAEVVLTPEPLRRDSLRAERRVAVSDGRFEIPDVPPGRYRVHAEERTAAGASASWTFARATVNGIDVTDTIVDITAGQPATAAIELTQTHTRFEGALETPSTVVPQGYVVVVFPTDARLWFDRSRWIRAAPFADDGSFVIEGLAAGTYRVAVIDDVEPDEWFDAAFLETLVPASANIAIEPGRTVRQTFRVAGP